MLVFIVHFFEKFQMNCLIMSNVWSYTNGLIKNCRR